MDIAWMAVISAGTGVMWGGVSRLRPLVALSLSPLISAPIALAIFSVLDFTVVCSMPTPGLPGVLVAMLEVFSRFPLVFFLTSVPAVVGAGVGLALRSNATK